MFFDPADVAAPDAGGGRVVRGGSYFVVADRARAAFRLHWNPNLGNRLLGLRVVLPPVAAPRAD